MEAPPRAVEDGFARIAKAPLIKVCKMAAEMRQETLDICISSIDKHASDYERCCQVRLGLANVHCDRSGKRPHPPSLAGHASTGGKRDIG